VSFADRLEEAVERKGNPCLVGLDPHLDLLPDEFAGARDPALPRAERAHLLARFCCELIDVVADRAPAVKPQSAFFEQLGADGTAAWERVVAHARAAGLIVIGDVKRGDISSTAAAYARAFLSGLEGCERDSLCDAVTLNAFLGEDSVRPFLEACRETGAGLYVLVRTSNPGSADFQRHGDPELSLRIADAVAHWGTELMGQRGLSSVGAVVGATHGAELRTFRARMPRTPLLLPGYGAQGASARDVVDAFLPHTSSGPRRPSGALVNSSRGISFAYRSEAGRGRPWKDAASAALDTMIAELREALRSGS
jgi:orotidine-5'-phosphate decarboxylase